MGGGGGGGSVGVGVVPTLMSTIDKSPNVVTLKNKFPESSLRQGFNLLLCQHCFKAMFCQVSFCLFSLHSPYINGHFKQVPVFSCEVGLAICFEM